MSGICGFFDQDVDRGGAARLEAMVLASGPSTASASRRTGAGVALAAFGSDAPASLLDIDGFLLVVVGHPAWERHDGRVADVAAIAKALRQDWTAALPRIGGDFALAAWDPALSRGLLAVDRVGMRRLAFARVGCTLAFTSTLDALRGFPGVQHRLSLQSIYDYLYFHVCPGPRSIYEGLHFLPPGHFIDFGPKSVGTPAAYWSLKFAEDRQPTYETLRQEFLDTMRTAVADASRGTATGSFLSGGTDSSTVAGMLGGVLGGPAPTFSIGFDAAGYDEMNYARIAQRHFGLDAHEYYVTPADVVDAVPRIAAFYDQPFGNASAVPAYYCARFARENGMSRLLAGDGGDELFGGNERYSRQYILGLYHRTPSALRALIEPVALSAPVRSLPGLRKVSRYVEQARPDMPWRYETYNLLHYLGPENVLHPDFLAAVDQRHPRQLLQEAHAPFADASLVNQLLGIDARFTLDDNDLPKVTGMCELAGVDVAFPMLDDRLVAFSTRLPANYKLRGTQLRWFFKEALRGFLPEEIITKQKHGFGLPVGDWLVGHAPLRSLANDAIHALQRHQFIRPSFIDELLQKRLQEHPKYFGNMVWILMMLGLWLDSRGH